MLKTSITNLLGAAKGERKDLSILVTSLVILLTYHLIFFRFFPNEHGLLGHDYSLFLPRLMDGYLWMKSNSLTDIPWFTPSFCGGVPAYPDPQNTYFSLPQLFTYYFNPLTSVYLSIIVMSVSGYAGCYVLLKSVFRTSSSAAILGSTLFLFNGFFIYRMIIGAIIFHSYMLFPWVIYFALKSASPKALSFKIKPWVINGVALSVLASYSVYSGMVNVLIPLGLSGLIIVLGFTYMRKLDSEHLKTISIGIAVFIMLVAGKLNASLAYLGNFDRSFYPLPGMENIFSVIYVTLRSLFFPSTDSSLQFFFTNKQWGLGRHEFEYGITLVPLIILATYLASKKRYVSNISFKLPKITPRLLTTIAIVIILLIPIVLNFYQLEWNKLLKTLPVLKNSSTLIRFNIEYILPAIVLSSVLLDKSIKSTNVKILFAASLIVFIILINAFTDKEFYKSEKYDPLTINLLHKKLTTAEHLPKITFVGNIEDTNIYQHSSQRSADFLFGVSRLTCYEPMFGYRLEAFPRKSLQPGPVATNTKGYLNIKNPACYVFPEENSCTPGDHFSVDSKKQFDNFVSHKKYEFVRPMRQVILGYISVWGFGICILILLLAGIERIYPQFKNLTTKT